MSELGLNPRHAKRVHIEITTNDGAVYEVELENCRKADLGIERDTTEPFSTDGITVQRLGMESALVTLTAHGKIVKAVRETVR